MDDIFNADNSGQRGPVLALSGSAYGAVDMIAMMDDDCYYCVSLMEGENTVEVEVTAEDGMMMIYAVKVAFPAAQNSLFETYDVNYNMEIGKEEALTSIKGYLFHGSIAKDEMPDLAEGVGLFNSTTVEASAPIPKIK